MVPYSHPGLPRTILAYNCCSRLVINQTLFYCQKCPGLEDLNGIIVLSRANLQQGEKVNHARKGETFIQIGNSRYGLRRKFTKINTGRSLTSCRGICAPGPDFIAWGTRWSQNKLMLYEQNCDLYFLRKRKNNIKRFTTKQTDHQNEHPQFCIGRSQWRQGSNRGRWWACMVPRKDLSLWEKSDWIRIFLDSLPMVWTWANGLMCLNLTFIP